MRNIILSLRVIIYFIPIFLIILAFSKYFAFSGVQEWNYDFKKNSPVISILWPPEHTSDPYEINGDFMQDIKKDPVSFSVFLTRDSFQKMKLTFLYQKSEDLPLKIGLQKGDGSWDFFFKEFKTEDILQKNEWKEAQVTFDITREFINKKGRINILLSSPGLSEKGEKITFSEIRATLTRPKLTFFHLFRKVGIFYE